MSGGAYEGGFFVALATFHREYLLSAVVSRELTKSSKALLFILVISSFTCLLTRLKVVLSAGSRVFCHLRLAALLFLTSSLTYRGYDRTVGIGLIAGVARLAASVSTTCSECLAQSISAMVFSLTRRLISSLTISRNCSQSVFYEVILGPGVLVIIVLLSVRRIGEWSEERSSRFQSSM